MTAKNFVLEDFSAAYPSSIETVFVTLFSTKIALYFFVRVGLIEYEKKTIFSIMSFLEALKALLLF